MKRWHGALCVKAPMTFRRPGNGGLILSFGFGFVCRRPNDWRTHG